MKAKNAYLMDYIPDKSVFRAVMFARNMIRQGKEPSIAIRRASNYFDVDMTDVAHYVGQCGGRKEKKRR